MDEPPPPPLPLNLGLALLIVTCTAPPAFLAPLAIPPATYAAPTPTCLIRRFALFDMKLTAETTSVGISCVIMMSESS